ncbi:MAG: TonB-dependent receptor [Rhizomicrobium sp.]
MKTAILAGSALSVAALAPAAAQVAADTTAKSPNGVETVIVTAEKRPEAVRAISGSVSAFTGEDLQALGAQDMADYLTRTPGVVFNAQQPGDSSVTIRGVSTTTSIEQGQATVGYFINDVPLTDPSYSIATPDIDAFDVDNIVVLRGPQGALFGSASLGGAINYQAAKPDLTQFDMHLQETVEGVDHGDAGGSGKIMVNIPITDTFAIRGVYVYRNDPGYIDNIGTGQTNSNETLVRGGRIEALWKPTAHTTISYLFLDQSENTADLGYQQPTLAGELKKDTLLPETANFGTLIHNLRFDQDFSFGTLTATATYHQKSQYSIVDDTPLFGGFFPGAAPVTIAQPAKSTGKTFEVRFASPEGSRFEYLVGLYYDETHEKVSNIGAGTGVENSIETYYSPIFGAGIGALSAPNNVWLDAYIPIEGKEKAAFGEFTYHFNDAWKATLGGRLYQEDVASETDSSGFYVLATDGTLTNDVSGKQKASGFSPKGSITWTPSDDFMSYFLVSKGFRLGGPNVTPSAPGAPVPSEYGSDSLINYELGARTNLFDNRLQLDATAFYIDWSNIQLELQTPTHLNYTTNAGAARNLGVETSATFAVTNDLLFSTNLTYLDAALSQDFNPGGGTPIVPKGTTLPGASKWQISNTLTYDWINGPLEPSFVLANRYLSRAPGGLITGAPQGGYDLVDARVSVHMGSYSLTAFVNNIGDSRGVTSALDASVSGSLQQFLVQPRTIGVTADYKM